MKKYFFLLIAVLMNLLVYAQSPLSHQKTKADYERVFKCFAKFYNNNQADSLNSLFDKYKEWSNESIKECLGEFGTIVTFKYIGSLNNENDVDGNPMRYFKVTFSKQAQLRPEVEKSLGTRNSFDGKKVHAAAIALTKNGQIGGIRFPTSSPQIDSLLAKH